MANEEKISEEKFWKDTIKEYQKYFIVAVIAAVFAFIGALLVVFWIIEVNPFVDPRTGTFDDWTLNYVVGFMILLTFAELLFIGIPALLVFGLGGYVWWSNLTPEKKQEFKEREKKKSNRKKDYGGGGGFSFFMFIAYCIIMGLERNYNTRFGDKSYSYWMYYWFITLMWIFIILGIPAIIICVILYFTVWRKKKSE